MYLTNGRKLDQWSEKLMVRIVIFNKYVIKLLLYSWSVRKRVEIFVKPFAGAIWFVNGIADLFKKNWPNILENWRKEKIKAFETRFPLFYLRMFKFISTKTKTSAFNHPLSWKVWNFFEFYKYEFEQSKDNRRKTNKLAVTKRH